MKALIVDDDAIAGDYLVKLLKRIDRNWSTMVTKNGTEALNKVKEEEYQLIILDLQLPDCHGLDVCRGIRERYNHTQTKILALSGFLTPEAEKAIIRAGADSYLSKIFSLQEFIDKINSLFS